MSWYRDSDGKIITDEEFQSACYECSAFSSEGTITVPCNGERTDCPHFKEVDTSEYDKKIRDKAIEELARKFIYEAVCSGCSGCTGCYEEERQYECENWKSYMEIAEQMKEVGE